MQQTKTINQRDPYGWNNRCGSNECLRDWNSLYNHCKQDRVISKAGTIGVGPKDSPGSV